MKSLQLLLLTPGGGLARTPYPQLMQPLQRLCGLCPPALWRARASLTHIRCMPPLALKPPQVAHSPYSGFVDCFKRVVASEGVGALWRSYR